MVVKILPGESGTLTPNERSQEPIEHAALSELRHSLRTPVNHMLGYTEMLIEDAAEARHQVALDVLRQIHSTAKGALSDINSALANRDSVERAEVDALCGRIRPRVERIVHFVETLCDNTENTIPEDWIADLERIAQGARALLAIFGEEAAASSAEAEVHIAPSPPRPQSGGPRVLVVDDNAANRTVLSRRLDRQGYAVEEAANGGAALDRIATEDFDLVLLDIMMPVLDGFEVLARMRQDRRMRTIPVVVISALDEVDSVVRAIEMGAEDYLLKPFDPVLLRARIGALLERKRLVNELAVQAKLASLGALTAGIAHEIKNPLNFVLNFAQLAEEAAREQLQKLDEAGDAPSAELLSEVRELAADLASDIGKIREHGMRADGIIASMLAHSRGQPGERRPTDINALVRDYVNLAFHGMRAQDNTFQASIEGDYDPKAGIADVVPQDLSRVFLNIAQNAFYAMRRKAREVPGYQPELRVVTRDLGADIEIRIRDNGTGIPKDVLDRVFDPFFTTKPAGEGAGLGLSIAHEIVVQEHQGEIAVDSQEGQFTEFVITVPRSAEPV